MNIHAKPLWREEPVHAIGEVPVRASGDPAVVETVPRVQAASPPTAAATATAEPAQPGEVARKLATVVAIDAVEPHPDAHSLAVATVRGWKVVTNKERDGYKAGDVAVYVEIDTVIPEELLVGLAEHAILQKKNFTVKTAKIRGVVSQGILFKPSIVRGRAVAVGEDVTQELGLQKKEYPAVSTGADLVCPFPAYIPRTDEERIQNIPADVLETLRHTQLYATEKVDGSSTTVFMKSGEFSVASRNWVVGPGSAVHIAATALGVEKRMREHNADNIALQGELLGPKYQGNRYKLKANTIAFFSVYDIAAKAYLSFADARALVARLGLQWVPVVEPSLTLGADVSIASLLQMAEGKSALCKTTEREGLVLRAVHEQAAGPLKRVSFKVISNKYLLKYES